VRKERGEKGSSDNDEKKPDQERKEEIREYLENQGLSAEEIEDKMKAVFEDNTKYLISKADIETPSFFTVRPRGGELIITLNKNHPVYDNLVSVIEDYEETDDIEVIRSGLERAKAALRLLLYAWARYEDENAGREKDIIRESRIDWGRIAKQFLK